MPFSNENSTKPTFIKHRVNIAEALKDVAPTWGVEIDLRSDLSTKGKLHLSHDAWARGEDFEIWLKEFSRLQIQGPLILNTKEDGLESRILELLNSYKVFNFFFLDTALPTLIQWTHKRDFKNIAVRLSHYEPAEFVRKFAQKAEWVWVDCFDGIPIPSGTVRELRKDFKVCLVSPELQGKLDLKHEDFLELAELSNAICTKHPKEWEVIVGSR